MPPWSPYVTIAVGFAKDVLIREALSAWVGRPRSGGLDQRTPAQSAPHQVLVAHELAGLLPRRNALSYKGDFGKLAIVAGSPGFTGAPVLLHPRRPGDERRIALRRHATGRGCDCRGAGSA